MEIKLRLKELGIKLLEFAKELDISRPTLDNYIALYEKDEDLPSEKYQIIFENLFDDGIETKEEFENVLASYRHLIQRDKILGVKELSVEKTDLLSDLIGLIKRDIESEDYCKDIYAFINMLVRSYKDIPTYRRFSDYFLYLNGKKDINDIVEEDKAFYANLYDLMKKDTENRLVYDSELFSLFENRVNEILITQNEQEEDLTEKIMKEKFDELVRKAIKDKIKQGYDVKDIDPETLFDSIDLSDL
ncbi:hypothetical protein [Sedimentibacter saalensis]|uniref:Uncharacterized protein n=1 Tax=Sedimentibacter saalensis TaxID=130788 RepID=A0A562J3T4_9FIRM|nr:hypothetical protein [Sedimentibacter saalensis]TWH77763.1 hypothetical protein LY60_03272 [Sedimentibacter saalensis]